MSDTEDFLFQINLEELNPEEAGVERPERKKRKRSDVKKKRKNKKMKIPRVVPNHFIAFRIHDSIIRQRIADVQKKIVEKNPLLNKALVDVRTLHVTLAVTHLENEERTKELQRMLRDWGEKDMKAHFSEPMHLTFKGIGTFRREVAFIKINECENYKRLCNLSGAVNDLLSSAGFYSESKKFTPHLTLLKLSKNYKLFKGNKSVSDDIDELKECKDYFGCQDVRDIQLLSMLAKKDDNGYYKCLWEQKTETSPEEPVNNDG